jgi:hypothetical protein
MNLPASVFIFIGAITKEVDAAVNSDKYSSLVRTIVRSFRLPREQRETDHFPKDIAEKLVKLPILTSLTFL